MKTKPDSIKKFVTIGLSLFVYKSVLLAFAYFLSKEDYNLFNQSYYTASIIILFAALGFNISQTRIPLSTVKIFLLVSLNSLITFVVLYSFTNSFINTSKIIPVFIYSVIVSTGGVLNFRLLFQGKYQTYFLIMIMLAFSHFAVIPFVILFNLDTFFVLSILVLIWFAASYNFFDKSYKKDIPVTEYYKVGFSAFIINSAVSLGLAGDKFIVNHYFTTDIANAYTFAWGLTAPIFYIGNMIEKYLFAEEKPGKEQILIKGLWLSIFLIAAYGAIIISVVIFYPAVLPESISKQIFTNIFVFMISGYSVYVILHFPLNSYLFKVADTSQQKTIAAYFSAIIIAFLFVFYFLINIPSGISYRALLISIWTYIFILLIVKALIIFKGRNNISADSGQIIPEDIKEIP